VPVDGTPGYAIKSSNALLTCSCKPSFPFELCSTEIPKFFFDCSASVYVWQRRSDGGAGLQVRSYCNELPFCTDKAGILQSQSFKGVALEIHTLPSGVKQPLIMLLPQPLRTRVHPQHRRRGKFSPLRCLVHLVSSIRARPDDLVSPFYIC
jgi:hypothetical protein